MRPVQPRNYNADDLTAAITDQATPPAMVSLLQEADAWPVDVAIGPYCGCGHIYDGLSAAGYEARHLAAMIAPGAVHARAALTRSFVLSVSSGAYHEMYSSDGGTTGNDVIRVGWYLTQGAGYVPLGEFQYGQHSIVNSGGSIIDAPTLPTDRQLELQSLGAPYVEPLYISKSAGFSLCVTDQVGDLTTL